MVSDEFNCIGLGSKKMEMLFSGFIIITENTLGVITWGALLTEIALRLVFGTWKKKKWGKLRVVEI